MALKEADLGILEEELSSTNLHARYCKSISVYVAMD